MADRWIADGCVAIQVGNQTFTFYIIRSKYISSSWNTYNGDNGKRFFLYVNKIGHTKKACVIKHHIKQEGTDTKKYVCRYVSMYVYEAW